MPLAGNEAFSSERFIVSKEIEFSGSEYYCVLCADMVNSTRTAMHITDSSKLRSFYGNFINSLSEVADIFCSKVIKIAGDSIICYFPETKGCDDMRVFRKVLECGLGMIDARCKINSKLHAETLPTVSYRISADYGRHEVVKTLGSISDVKDLISSTMNVCCKINSMAAPNSMMIGGDLYEIVKSSCPDFCFDSAGQYFTGLKNAYPVYSVSRRAQAISSRSDLACEGSLAAGYC
ncbi:MAG: adenylate/guanylate cyclase domain-containing protein [Nitrososphaera sp.]|jgi:class 3 adenylate cyclase